MSFGRNIKFPIIIILLTTLCCAALFLMVSHLLPGFVQSRLISILKKDIGISELTLDLRELDLEGANLGPLRLGSPRSPALVIQSVQVSYTPGELYRKKIKKITASGVEVHIEYVNGQWGLRGLELNNLIKQIKTSLAKDNSAPTNSASFPNHIEINSGTLIWSVNDKTYRLPFDIGIAPQADTEDVLVATARLYPRGQLLSVLAHIDLKQNHIQSEINAEGIELLRFADLWQGIDSLHITGAVGLKAETRLRLAPFEIASISGRLKGSDLNIKYGRLHFRPPAGTADQTTPFAIDFTGSGKGKLVVTLSNLALRAPLAATLSDLSLTLNLSETGYPFSGSFNLSAAAEDNKTHPAGPPVFDQPFSLPFHFSGHLAQHNQWRIELAGKDSKNHARGPASFQYNQYRTSMKMPAVELSVRSGEGIIDMAYRLQVPKVRVQAESVDIFFPLLVLTGETHIEAAGTQRDISKFNLDLSGSVMKTPAGSFRLKQLTMDGQLMPNEKGRQKIIGRLRFSNTKFEGDPGKIVLAGARGNIPFEFPAPQTGRKGMLSIKNTRMSQLDLGAVQAEVRQTLSGLSFNGNLNNPKLPALTVAFAGTSEFGPARDHQTRARVTIAYPATGPEIDLGKIAPAAEGFTFSGKFWEQSDMVFGKNGWQAVAKTQVQNGALRNRRNKIAVEGIQVEFLMPDLIKMRSAPGQKLKFSRASLGGLNLDNGEIDFQIESPQSFLIEKSHFNWADGNVDAPAIRFRSDIDDYRLILYCDRLNLAKVLEQLGAASVVAEGELNGRIPLQLKNGQLSFHDGFLFTTPGQPGKIRMTDTEILTAGIPPDTPQYAQMELARKALEDYDYTWARLNLTTEGEDLLLNMQLDGKPARSLPFVYRKDMGGFAKVEAGVQGSTFQGIRLDINFRLPLNKIMQYKELIEMIQQSRE